MNISVKIVIAAEASAFIEAANQDARARKADDLGSAIDIRRNTAMISEARLEIYRNSGTFYLLYVDEKPVSLNITRASTRKRSDAWGRYSSFYLAYTLPEYRFLGYASTLCRAVQVQLANDGYDRMKSLAGSWPGFRLHLALGHTFWGVAPEYGGCLVIDVPLHSGTFPRGTPRLIRSYKLDELWSIGKLINVLTNPKGNYQRTETEVNELFARRLPKLGKPQAASVL